MTATAETSIKAGSYTVLTGDATNPALENKQIAIIPHVCNDVGAWGAGFVLALNKRFGNKAMDAYQNWFAESYDFIGDDDIFWPSEDREFALGNAQIVRITDEIYIANMIAQHRTGSEKGGRPPIRYWALGMAMTFVGEGFEDLQSIYPGYDVQIHAPQFAAGLAGGHWPVIEQMIQEIWVDENFANVTVYKFGK